MFLLQPEDANLEMMSTSCVQLSMFSLEKYFRRLIFLFSSEPLVT